MNMIGKIMTVVMVICVSCSMAEWRIHEALKDQHCQPITTHKTLESAKAQVSAYQDRVGG